MEYTSEATRDLQETINNSIINAGKFSFELFNGDMSPAKVNNPPVLEIIKAMSFETGANLDQMDHLTRYCLLNRIVSVKYNDKEVGRFVMNDLEMPWETQQVFVDYPLALQFIINVCIAEVIKKSIPPQIKKV